MRKMPVVIAVTFFLLPYITSAGLIADVAKGVSVNIMSEVLKASISKQPEHYSATRGNNEDAARLQAIVNIPLAEKIGLYATTVDYFTFGAQDHNFILRERARFEERWPTRHYTLRSFDDIEISTSGHYAAIRYTIDYSVSRAGKQRSGTSKVAVLIGDFDSQPRIYAIKEWVEQNR